MKDVPDVLGMVFAEASGLLDKNNVRYVVTQTSPPRGPRPQGPLRVVRQTLDEGGVVHLVVAPAQAEPRF